MTAMLWVLMQCGVLLNTSKFAIYKFAQENELLLPVAWIFPATTLLFMDVMYEACQLARAYAILPFLRHVCTWKGTSLECVAHKLLQAWCLVENGASRGGQHAQHG